jgi:ribose 1,5-bisphosphate isomerase
VLVDTASKIKNMEIRGAGRIARAAVEALKEHAGSVDTKDLGDFRRSMDEGAALLLSTRPTAVSLPNAVHLVISALDGSETIDAARQAVSSAADAFIASSKQAVARIGRIGSRNIRSGDVVLTHCNSEAALACLLEAHRQGKDFEVIATEVRPRNQGLITLGVLDHAGITTQFIVDSAVRSFMHKTDLVIVGADAVAVNGTVVNKIGTAPIALAAHEARANFLVAAETYKFAPRTILGEMIEIEERNPDEVLPPSIADALPHVTVRNPAFDVTPAEYITMIVTEIGAIPPQMAYMIIRDYLGWGIEVFSRGTGSHGRD